FRAASKTWMAATRPAMTDTERLETLMPNKLLTGSFVALITPFNKDGAVDFGAFRSLLRFQEDNGTSAVLIMGSTGETSLLSPEERKNISLGCAKLTTAAMPLFC